MPLGSQAQHDATEAAARTEDETERDERKVWSGEVSGERASLVMSPRDASVDGIFLLWQGPVDPALRGAGGVAVITREGMRLAANFKLEPGKTPMAQLEIPETGVWNIEVTPPIMDAATVFAKPITFAVTAGESKVEAPRQRRPIRRFFNRPEVRYTIMGVGCFVLAIGIIVYRYRG